MRPSRFGSDWVESCLDDRNARGTGALVDHISGYSDLQLVEAVALQQEDAMVEIYRRHALSVAATARMVLGDASACHDVLAEVFLALWLKPEQFDPERGSLLGFLRLKARERSIDLVRSEVARRRREETEARSTVRYTSETDEELLRSEAAERMHKALESLVENEREPIELAFFARMTYRDIAKHLGLPEGTIKSRIREGLRNIRVVYESERSMEADADRTLPPERGRR